MALKFTILILLTIITLFYGKANASWVLGNFAPKSYTELVTVQPVFSPDNAEYWMTQLILGAKSSIMVINQYIKKYNSGANWLADGNPVMQAIVTAFNNGISVKVILEGTVDSEYAGGFLASMGIPVRYLGEGLYCHCKGMIIDGNTTLVSSINLDSTSMTSNREEGAIVYSTNIANYFSGVFMYDWNNGTTVTASSPISPSWSQYYPTASKNYAAITKVLNITAFTNPDNGYAYNLVTSGLSKARYYIHGEIYEMTTTNLVNAVSAALTAYPSLDCSLIISSKRVGTDTTWVQATSLYNAGCNMYNSSTTFDYQHSKFWMYDNNTVVFSGNWATTSLSYAGDSYKANREYGLLISNDYEFFQIFNNLFIADLNIVSAPFLTPLYCTNTSFDACGVCNGGDLTCNPNATPSPTPTVTPIPIATPSPSPAGPNSPSASPSPSPVTNSPSAPPTSKGGPVGTPIASPVATSPNTPVPSGFAGVGIPFVASFVVAALLVAVLF